MEPFQTYVNEDLLKKGLSYVVICGFKGTTWASSPGYKIGAADSVNLKEALESGVFGKFKDEGISINRQKYAFIQADIDNNFHIPFLIGRNKVDGLSPQGLVVMKTNQALIVAIYDPIYAKGYTFGDAVVAVGRVADKMFEESY